MGPGNKPKAGGNGEPQQESEQSATRPKRSSQGHRRRGRTEEAKRIFWGVEAARAKALRHDRV